MPGEQEQSVNSKALTAIAIIAFSLAGLVGAQVLTKLAEVELSVEELKIDVAVIKTDIQYMKLKQEAKAIP